MSCRCVWIGWASYEHLTMTGPMGWVGSKCMCCRLVVCPRAGAAQKVRSTDTRPELPRRAASPSPPKTAGARPPMSHGERWCVAAVRTTTYLTLAAAGRGKLPGLGHCGTCLSLAGSRPSTIRRIIPTRSPKSGRWASLCRRHLSDQSLDTMSSLSLRDQAASIVSSEVSSRSSAGVVLPRC